MEKADGVKLYVQSVRGSSKTLEVTYTLTGKITVTVSLPLVRVDGVLRKDDDRPRTITVGAPNIAESLKFAHILEYAVQLYANDKFIWALHYSVRAGVDLVAALSTAAMLFDSAIPWDAFVQEGELVFSSQNEEKRESERMDPQWQLMQVGVTADTPELALMALELIRAGGKL